MTILILLILTGITVGLVFSDNGIIAKAKESAEKTNQAVINEQMQMNDVVTTMENILRESDNDDQIENIDPETGWDLNKVNKVESTDGTIVPVPKGYTASDVAGENTVKDGFVIYENITNKDKEEVNNENKNEAQEMRNQFVWVPVENVNEMYGTDKDGKKWGKLYSFGKDKIYMRNWTEENGIMNITSTSDDYVSFREPDILTSDESSYNLKQAGLDSEDTANTLKIKLEGEFDKIIISIGRYGGFYIGRYETGDLSEEEAVVVKNNSDIADQTWYTMYNKSKGIAANSNVTTSMIWGCQWDATLSWMYNSGDNNKKEYTYNSIEKGNYGATIIPTGTNDTYAVNNIYDMAGNVTEWTIESLSNGQRTLRGGRYR